MKDSINCLVRKAPSDYMLFNICDMINKTRVVRRSRFYLYLYQEIFIYFAPNF